MMKKLWLIRIFSALLCISMMAEISIPINEGIVLSAEADSEMEHEESTEKEKEKNTNGYDSVDLMEKSLINQISLAIHHDRFWNTPFIDFQTPPPKLTSRI